MIVRYGPRGHQLTLQIVRTNYHHRIPRFSSDGTTYLYTEWLFDFDCIFNPGATAFQKSPGGGPGDGTCNIPVAVLRGVTDPATGRVDGQWPAQTDAAIRHLLAIPRQVVTLVDEANPANVLLESPMTFTSVAAPLDNDVQVAGDWNPTQPATVDARYGPLTRVLDIRQTIGFRTYIVRVQFVTWINECCTNTVNLKTRNLPNPVLSHRWRRYVDIDEDHFSIVVGEGEVIFRSDVLAVMQRKPDQYRMNFFHPVDTNFQRQTIHTSAASDGTTVNYKVVDKEMPFNLGRNSTATRLECYQTSGASVSGTAAFVLGAFEAARNLSVRPIVNVAPKFMNHVLARAWGDRNSDRGEGRDALEIATLMGAATGVVLNRMAAAEGQFGHMDAEIIITHEVTGKFVEVQMTRKTGAEQAIGVNKGGDQSRIALELIADNFGPEDFNIPKNIIANDSSDIGNPSFVLGAFGTWLENVVAQGLQDACKVPRTPANLLGSNFVW